MKDFRNLGVEDWLGILWRRKWYFLALAILVPAGATYYARNLVEIYRSETMIQIISPVSEDYVRPITATSPQTRINAIREMIESRTFLKGIIEEFRLFRFGEPNFVMEDAVLALRSNIRIDSGLGTTFKLSYASTTPDFAREVTRRVADKLTSANNQDRKNRAERTDSFIEDQLRQTQGKLADQEDKIKQFKIDHMAELPGMVNIETRRSLSAQLDGTENAIQQDLDQRKQLELRLTRLDIMSKSFPAAAPGVPARADGQPNIPYNADLAALRGALEALKNRGYTDAHPDVKRLNDRILALEQNLASARPPETQGADNAELTPLGSNGKTAPVTEAPSAASTMVELEAASIKLEMEKIDRDLERRRKDLPEISSQAKLIEAKLKQAPVLEQELDSLMREEERLRGQYAGLQDKKFNSNMATTLETNTSGETYKILDEANLPEKPVFPDRTHIILMGIGAGLMLGLGAVVAREYLDPTLGEEIEAAAVLGLPVLASIPEVLIEGVRGRKSLPQKAGAA